MHKQLTHIIVILMETLRAIVHSQKESEAVAQNKRMFLLKQADRVARWV